ncbi:HD domain-containing protein [Aerophototrophica crusticola]|uniref:HD domain-containing protein n=1 Tax=Aerophototrophica crusticola TaxID=1709002 RepID=A0A858R3Z9_9PROT|nr:HD domain-containing protein [Rhodospirillaceae bacterium B3]
MPDSLSFPDALPPTLASLRMVEHLRDLLHERSIHALHQDRVGRLTGVLARALDLGAARADMMVKAASAHDIGKLAIPDGILFKTTPLTHEDWAVIHRHSELGHQVLSGSGDPLMDLAASIALNHHEAFDGSGYPNGLRGTDIPYESRVVTVCDVYDALRSDRPYKPGFSHDRAVDSILNGDDRITPAKFDPEVLSGFKDALPRIRGAWEG